MSSANMGSAKILATHFLRIRTRDSQGNITKDQEIKLKPRARAKYSIIFFLCCLLAILLICLVSLQADSNSPFLWRWLGQFSQFIFFEILEPFYYDFLLIFLVIGLLFVLVLRIIGHNKRYQQLKLEVNSYLHLGGLGSDQQKDKPEATKIILKGKIDKATRKSGNQKSPLCETCHSPGPDFQKSSIETSNKYDKAYDYSNDTTLLYDQNTHHNQKLYPPSKALNSLQETNSHDYENDLHKSFQIKNTNFTFPNPGQGGIPHTNSYKTATRMGTLGSPNTAIASITDNHQLSPPGQSRINSNMVKKAVYSSVVDDNFSSNSVFSGKENPILPHESFRNGGEKVVLNDYQESIMFGSVPLGVPLGPLSDDPSPAPALSRDHLDNQTKSDYSLYQEPTLAIQTRPRFPPTTSEPTDSFFYQPGPVVVNSIKSNKPPMSFGSVNSVKSGVKRRENGS